MKSIVNYLFLFFICAFILSLTVPTVGQNIGDPNMVVYNSSDEGGLMDEIWHYYSGEKRPSFQWDFDYGLEMVYIADFARVFLSKFVVFQPGTFVLILRSLHIAGWLLAMFALWRLIGNHFGKGWQQVLGVSLLATRPSFAYFSANMKPEPLVLFLMIVGLGLALDIIERPGKRNILLAVALATAAFLIKFSGIFLLIAIVAAMYFSKRPGMGEGKIAGDRYGRRLSWIFPGLIGLALIAVLFALIVFYVRKATGTTWFEEYGLIGTFKHHKMIAAVFLGGVILIAVSFAELALLKSRNRSVSKIGEGIAEINHYSLVVAGLFALFTLIFGFRWVVTPSLFINTYAQLGPIAANPSHYANAGLMASSFLGNLLKKISALDIPIFIFFCVYLIAEFRFQRTREAEAVRYKRLTLLIFLIPVIVLTFLGVRSESHHLLPFFVALTILSMQGIAIFSRVFKDRRIIAVSMISIYAVVMFLDVAVNGTAVVRKRLRAFEQRSDIAYEIKDWFERNVPAASPILSDQYALVYLSEDYRNVKIVKGMREERIAGFRRSLKEFRPAYVYYNAGADEEAPLPDAAELLPGAKIEFVKIFDPSGRKFIRKPDDRFIICKVFY